MFPPLAKDVLLFIHGSHTIIIFILALYMPFNVFNSVARLQKKSGGVSAGLWVAVGDGGLISKSSNGNTWTQAASVSGITTSGRGVAFKNEID